MKRRNLETDGDPDLRRHARGGCPSGLGRGSHGRLFRRRLRRAQKKSMIDPYVAAKGTNILFEDYSGGVAEMTAQVESATSSGTSSTSRPSISSGPVRRAARGHSARYAARGRRRHAGRGRLLPGLARPTNAASASCSGR